MVTNTTALMHRFMWTISANGNVCAFGDRPVESGTTWGIFPDCRGRLVSNRREDARDRSGGVRSALLRPSLVLVRIRLSHHADEQSGQVIELIERAGLLVKPTLELADGLIERSFGQ